LKRIILAGILSAAINTPASQEGILPLSAFHIESAGIGHSGRVVIDGKQNEKGQIDSLKITAFGKDYSVPKDKLANLADLHVNGIRISYEGGWVELGGQTIYIHLQMGFTSHTLKHALIVVTECGKIDVSNIGTNDVLSIQGICISPLQTER
jgi:hypothetical protein